MSDFWHKVYWWLFWIIFVLLTPITGTFSPRGSQELFWLFIVQPAVAALIAWICVRALINLAEINKQWRKSREDERRRSRARAESQAYQLKEEASRPERRRTAQQQLAFRLDNLITQSEALTGELPKLNLEATIKAKDVERVRQLLASGADPNATDERREPMLILAIKWGQVEIAELLISAGADVNMVNRSDNGSTPLHFAAGATVWVPSVAIAKLLLAKGACVDATTGAGTTPLMWVAQSNEKSALDVAELLIAHGASLHRQGEDGNALQYAKDTSNAKMVDMLSRRGKAARLANPHLGGRPGLLRKLLQAVGIVAPTKCTKCNSTDVELTTKMRRHDEWKCHDCGNLWYKKRR